MSIDYCDECEAVCEGVSITVQFYCSKCDHEEEMRICPCGAEVVGLPEDDWRDEW